MQKRTLILVLTGLMLINCKPKPTVADNLPVDQLRWMNLAEAVQSLNKEKKPLLIDLYTDWCSWCKVMDKKTYSNAQVAAYLQDKFYPVKLNAETREVLSWNGGSYSYNSNYRVNELAVYFTEGKLAFPTTVIIPADGQPQAIPGYLEPKDLELVVKYFAEGKYGRIPFDQYQRGFKPSWQ